MCVCVHNYVVHCECTRQFQSVRACMKMGPLLTYPWMYVMNELLARGVKDSSNPARNRLKAKS